MATASCSSPVERKSPSAPGSRLACFAFPVIRATGTPEASGIPAAPAPAARLRPRCWEKTGLAPGRHTGRKTRDHELFPGGGPRPQEGTRVRRAGPPGQPTKTRGDGLLSQASEFGATCHAPTGNGTGTPVCWGCFAYILSLTICHNAFLSLHI